MAGHIRTAGFAEWAEVFYRSGQSLDSFEREFMALAQERDWATLLPEDKWLLHDRLALLYRCLARAFYARHRLQQLMKADFAFWVYRTGSSVECADQHRALEGLTLAPSHSFWEAHSPPNDWGCTCYLTGARTEAGARRVGGDLTRQPSGSWAADVRVPSTFLSRCGPEPDEILAAVLDDSAF